MEIQDLRFTNFKGTTSAAYHLGTINVFMGANGTGKTTVLDAVKTVLNGRPPVDHIRVGSSSAEVTAVLPSIGVIRRTWTVGKPSKVYLNEKATTAKSVVDAIRTVEGFSPETTQIMSSGDVMAGMFGADAAKYILGLVSSNSLDVDTLLKAFSATLSPQSVIEATNYLPAAPAKITLAELESAYDYYKAARAAHKKELAAASAQAAYEGDIPKLSLAELDKMLQQASEMKGRYDAAEKAFKASQRVMEENKAKIAKLAAEIAALPAKASEPQVIKNLEEQERALTDALTQYTGQASGWTTLQKQTSAILSKLGTEQCPLCDKLKCTTDKSPLCAELQETMKKCETQLGTLRAQYKEAVEKREQVRRELAVERDRAQKVALRKEKADALENLKATVTTVAPAPNPEAGRKIQARLTALMEYKPTVMRYEQSVEAQKAVVRLTNALKIDDELCELFSPKGGARRRVMENAVSAIQGYVDDCMKRVLPKYRMVLDASDGFNVRFESPAAPGEFIQYAGLSNGEKIRAMFVLTDMLNELNGFRILLLDNLDGLDEESLAELCKCIAENYSRYDHILLASVRTAEAEKVFGDLVRSVPNSQVIMMT